MSVEQKLEMWKNIRKGIKKVLIRMFGYLDQHEDLAYMMSRAYFECHGFVLIDEEILNDKGDVTGVLHDCSYDGNSLNVTVKWFEPIYYMNVKVTLDDIKKAGQ